MECTQIAAYSYLLVRYGIAASTATICLVAGFLADIYRLTRHFRVRPEQGQERQQRPQYYLLALSVEPPATAAVSSPAKVVQQGAEAAQPTFYASSNGRPMSPVSGAGLPEPNLVSLPLRSEAVFKVRSRGGAKCKY
jgi:hypothetical protein